MLTEPVTVAIVQDQPVFYDLPATLEKTESLAAETAATDARLIAFGETWLPDYPSWLDVSPDMGKWNHTPTKKVFDRLCKLAGQLKVMLVIGMNERVDQGLGTGTLYNGLLIINERGELAVHHRKLIPTYTEKLVWGQGDGAGLRAAATAATW